MKTTKVILSILLAAILLFSALPMTVFADDTTVGEGLDPSADDVYADLADGDADIVAQSPDAPCVIEDAYVEDDLAASGAEDDLAESGAGYGLWVGSRQVTESNRYDVLEDGGSVKYDASTNTLTLNVPDIKNVCHFNDDETALIYCQINDILHVKGKYSSGYARADYGIFCKGNSAGLLFDGDFVFVGKYRGIYAHSSITVNSGSCVGRATDEEHSFGIASWYSRITIRENVDFVEAESPATAIFADGGIYNSTVVPLVAPTDYNYDGNTFRDPESGYSADRVIYQNPDVMRYHLWLGRTQVTERNKDDILLDGGKAKFDPTDPANEILTLKNPIIYDCASYFHRNNTSNYCKIWSDVENLTVKGSYRMDDGGDLVTQPSMVGFDSSGNVTFDGNFTFLGYGAEAVALIGYNLTLTIAGGRFFAEQPTEQPGMQTAVRCDGTLIIEKRCELFDAQVLFPKEEWSYAVRAEDVLLDEDLEFVEPVNGVLIRKSWAHFYESDGETWATHVQLKNGNFKNTYGLWLGDTQVTQYNYQDIYGDGKASYDPSSRTLTLDNPIITDKGKVAQAAIAYTEEGPLYLKGNYHMSRADFIYGFDSYENGTINFFGDFTFKGKLIGIYTQGDILSNYSLTAEGTGSAEYDQTWGIYSHGDITVGGASLFDAKGTAGAIWAENAFIDSQNDRAELILPRDGIVGAHTVFNGDNTTYAKRVLYQYYVGNIDSITLYGTPDPIAGQSSNVVPDGSVGAGEKCYIASKDWLYYNSEFDCWSRFNGTFVEGTTYQVQYVIKPGFGYLFSDEVGVTIFGNHSTTVYNPSIEDGTLTVCRTCVAREAGPAVIHSIKINGNPSAAAGTIAAEHPPMAWIDGQSCRITSSGWKRYVNSGGGSPRLVTFTGEFVGGASYFPTYTIEPNEGYFFPDGTIYVTFGDGSTQAASANDNGKVTIQRGPEVIAYGVGGYNGDGFTLRGSVTFPTADGTYFDGKPCVELYQNDHEVMSAIAWGTYELEGVMPGDYVLRVIGKNCVDHDYAVTVSGDTELDVQINALGDVNLNGVVDIKDVNALYKHVMETKKITDPYAIQCGDVSKDYNTVDIKDVNALYKHVMETKVLY